MDIDFNKNIVWATYWEIFSKTHLAALVSNLTKEHACTLFVDLNSDIKGFSRERLSKQISKGSLLGELKFANFSFFYVDVFKNCCYWPLVGMYGRYQHTLYMSSKSNTSTYVHMYKCKASTCQKTKQNVGISH
jgi:hypothetical protein